MTKSELLSSLRNLVNYHRICGVESYVASDNLDQAMEILAGIDTLPVPGDSDHSGNMAHRVEKDAEEGPFAHDLLASLTEEVACCRSCPLHQTREIDTAGRGGERPQLMIVGEWLPVGENAVLQGTELFGDEPDAMLAKMIAAIELGKQDVFITNAIKCSVPASRRPTDREIETCSSYLKRQIELLMPRVICTMGPTAAAVLLNTDQPLFRVRGKFRFYRDRTKREIPVMATFHPSFLVKNPEMKQATWNDLKAIRKLLSSS